MHPESLLAKRLQQVLSHIQEINLIDLLKKIENKTPFYLIDVREEAEWSQGSLPCAIHTPRGKLEFNIESLVSDLEADIVLYCGGGIRSALATETLKTMGYKSVKSLKGGLQGWRNAGLPLEIP